MVTDDRKDDWWLKISGRTLGPPPELINEIVSKADISFYMYSTDPFLLQARVYLEHHVSQHAIKEVQGIRERDERDLEYIKSVTNTMQIRNDVLSQAMAATQFPRISNEFLNQLNAAVQFPMDSGEFLNQLSAAAQFPGISNELLAQLKPVVIFPSTLAGLTAQAITDAESPNVTMVKKEIENGENIEKPSGEVTDKANE